MMPERAAAWREAGRPSCPGSERFQQRLQPRGHVGMLCSACRFPCQRKPGPANERAPRVSDGDLPQARGPLRTGAAGLGPCAPRDGPESSPTWALLQGRAAPRSRPLKIATPWPVSVDSFRLSDREDTSQREGRCLGSAWAGLLTQAPGRAGGRVDAEAWLLPPGRLWVRPTRLLPPGRGAGGWGGRPPQAAAAPYPRASPAHQAETQLTKDARLRARDPRSRPRVPCAPVWPARPAAPGNARASDRGHSGASPGGRNPSSEEEVDPYAPEAVVKFNRASTY